MSYWDNDQKPAPPASPGPSVKPAVLALDLHIDGHVTSKGRDSVQCQMSGNLAGPHISVEPDAVVQGDITAEQVELAGSVAGDVTAGKVNIQPTATVSGRISYETITIYAGAVVEGELRRKPAVVTVTPSAVPVPNGAEGE